MSLLNSFDGKANFWQVNPQLTIPEPLATLYQSDKSKEKQVSSQIMWAICFLLDLSEENKFKNFPEEDRRKIIVEDYLKNSSFKFTDYQQIINWYKEAMMLPAERELLNWRTKMEERSKFIASTPYDLDTAAELDKVMANTDKIFNQLERINKLYTKEALEAKDKGGSEASSTDKGMM